MYYILSEACRHGGGGWQLNYVFRCLDFRLIFGVDDSDRFSYLRGTHLYLVACLFGLAIDVGDAAVLNCTIQMS